MKFATEQVCIHFIIAAQPKRIEPNIVCTKSGMEYVYRKLLFHLYFKVVGMHLYVCIVHNGLTTQFTVHTHIRTKYRIEYF